MFSKRYILVFIAVMLGIGMIAVENYTKDFNEQKQDISSGNPDYYGKGLINKRYGDNGSLEYKFSANTSTNYPTQKVTEFTNPIVTTSDESDSFWQITADTGVLHQKDDRTEFKQNVIVSPEGENPSNIKMATEQLNFLTKKSFVYNKLPVKVTSANGYITAIGMEMDIEQEKIVFLSKVKAQYRNTETPVKNDEENSDEKD